jgi:hypothetical protein
LALRADCSNVAHPHSFEGGGLSGILPADRERKHHLLARFDGRHEVVQKNVGTAGMRVFRSFHGNADADDDKVRAILKNGLLDLRLSDPGWFGAGVYTTLDAAYSTSTYANPASAINPWLFVCWQYSSWTYPITRCELDFGEKLETPDCKYFDQVHRIGTSLRGGHDTHVVVVDKDVWKCVETTSSKGWWEVVTQAGRVYPMFALQLLKRKKK